MIYRKMKDITKREDFLALSGDIRITRKSRFVPVVMLLLGVALIVSAFMVDKEAHNLSTALLTAGFVLTIVGVVMCVCPGDKVIYEPTGERVHLKKRSHEQSVMPNVERAIVDGNVSALELLQAEGSGPLMSVCWSTHSGSFYAAQLQQYVPYEYKPTMEPVVIIK